MYKSSITDKPRNASFGEKDNFGIEPFENGLTDFINNSNTPITIALQGEWGSGKTSLMNSLKKNLSDSENSKFHSIWLNTWEYALMKDAQTTLMDIITGLIQETSKIAKVDETTTKKMLGKLWSGIKDTSKVVAKNALDKTIDGAGSIIDTLSTNAKSSISEVRNELEDIIEKCITKDNKQGFIFFIDDLDRIDPPVAVNLLELLKNIFTLKNCVFVLAIDYDVVIKGLEPKFGKFSEQNEREFRSFFDKIIQVPFSMPIANYKIDTFLKDSLVTTNYISKELANNDELISKFSEIANLSVGKNPRALKRLMNSLSLIRFINSAKSNEQLNQELELLINFALVSIQIAYPPIYRLLSLYPGFDNWDERIALQMNLKPLDAVSIEKLNQTEEFDEEWEKVLFRICENDHYLKKRALSISRLLNSLRTYILEKDENVEDIISSIISLSSVTNLEAFDKPVVDYHKGNFLKKLRDLIVPELKKNLPNISNHIGQQGKRVQSNLIIKFSEKKWGHWIKIYSQPYEGGIKLVLNSHKKFPAHNHKNIEELMKSKGIENEFDNIKNKWNTLENKYPDFTVSSYLKYIINKDGYLAPDNYASIKLASVEDFYDKKNTDKIASFMTDFYYLLVEQQNLIDKLKK